MLVTVEWCTWGVDVGSTLNWHGMQIHNSCICTHGVFTYMQYIRTQYWGRDIHIIQNTVLAGAYQASKAGKGACNSYINCIDIEIQTWPTFTTFSNMPNKNYGIDREFYIVLGHTVLYMTAHSGLTHTYM